MVVGGDGQSGDPIGSTEIMKHDLDTVEMKWKIVDSLPNNYKLSGLRAVNYRNTIFVFGKILI